MLERYNQELKRRTRVVRIFPHQESCLRLVTAMAMETSEEWMVRRYLLFDMEIAGKDTKIYWLLNADIGDDNLQKIGDLTKMSTTGTLLIRNSLGRGWGEQGYGWLPYEYVLQGLAEDWWTMLKNEWIDTREINNMPCSCR